MKNARERLIWLRYKLILQSDQWLKQFESQRNRTVVDFEKHFYLDLSRHFVQHIKLLHAIIMPILRNKLLTRDEVKLVQFKDPSTSLSAALHESSLGKYHGCPRPFNISRLKMQMTSMTYLGNRLGRHPIYKREQL